jgi:type II secretory pathway pseudopilin PulG
VKPFPPQMREPASHGKAAARRRPREKGYILLTMLLVVALMAILALTVITEMKFTMKRDQEQEMIHRGVQYSRAIRGYYKQFGRYPTRLEDLDNTNNLRYLRKHYKDPITGKDFRLLHFGEQGVTVGSGGISLGGGTIPGATPVGGAPGGLSSGPGNSAFGGGSTFGNSGSGVNNSGVFAQSSGLGGNSNSGFGANSNSATNGSNTPGTNAANGKDASSSRNSQDSSSTKVSSAGASDQSPGQQLVSGGPIVGVASLSKNNTIREFNKKKKYNEWQFVYDPTTEPRSGLITTPNQPLLQGFGAQPLQNGQPGSANSSVFGQSSSFGSNSNSNGSATPLQPPANPPQPPQ